MEREEDISAVLEQYPTFIWVDRTNLDGRSETCEFHGYPTGVNRLDVIVVPRNSSVVTTAVEISSPLKRLIKKLRKEEDRA